MNYFGVTVKTVYMCERRRFATIAAASAFANKYFARWGVVVAITAKQVRK